MAIGFGVLGVVIAVLFFFGFWLPGWMEVQRKHNDFDQEWNKTRRE